MQTFGSKRIYKNILNDEVNQVIADLINQYNSITHYSFNIKVLAKRHPERALAEKEAGLTEYFKIKNKYSNVIPYLRNSAEQDAKALSSALDELRKLDIQTIKEKIKKVDEKIASVIEQKDNYQSIKNALKSGSNQPFKSKSTKYKILPEGTVTVTTGKKKYRHTKVYANLYVFEYQYLKEKQKQLKTRLGLLICKKNRLEAKLKKLEDKNYIPSAVFGSKKLFKQTQYNKNANLTRRQRREIQNKNKEFQYRRHKYFTVSGRTDSPDGNFVFRYNTNHEFGFVVNKKKYNLGQVVFPYGQSHIDDYYKNQNSLKNKRERKLGSKPITYTIENYGDYYIVKCALEVDYGPANHYKGTGALGVDCNFGFYSITNITGNGNIKESKDIHYDWHNKSSAQMLKGIEEAAKQVVDKAIELNKPIVIENLSIKAKDKVKSYNSSNCCNFKRNSFAYKTMISTIKARAAKCNVGVFEVNPSYTSFIGEIKYNKVYKRSIHQLAAFVIARRGIGLKERLPAKLGENTTWAKLYNRTKKQQDKDNNNKNKSANGKNTVNVKAKAS